MARDAYEPTVAKRCPECRMAHYDANFVVCRNCGGQL